MPPSAPAPTMRPIAPPGGYPFIPHISDGYPSLPTDPNSASFAAVAAAAELSDHTRAHGCILHSFNQPAKIPPFWPMLLLLLSPPRLSVASERTSSSCRNLSPAPGENSGAGGELVERIAGAVVHAIGPVESEHAAALSYLLYVSRDHTVFSLVRRELTVERTLAPLLGWYIGGSTLDGQPHRRELTDTAVAIAFELCTEHRLTSRQADSAPRAAFSADPLVLRGLFRRLVVSRTANSDEASAVVGTEDKIFDLLDALLRNRCDTITRRASAALLPEVGWSLATLLRRPDVPVRVFELACTVWGNADVSEDHELDDPPLSIAKRSVHEPLALAMLPAVDVLFTAMTDGEQSNSSAQPVRTWALVTLRCMAAAAPGAFLDAAPEAMSIFLDRAKLPAGAWSSGSVLYGGPTNNVDQGLVAVCHLIDTAPVSSSSSSTAPVSRRVVDERTIVRRARNLDLGSHLVAAAFQSSAEDRMHTGKFVLRLVCKLIRSGLTVFEEVVLANPDMARWISLVCTSDAENIDKLARREILRSICRLLISTSGNAQLCRNVLGTVTGFVEGVIAWATSVLDSTQALRPGQSSVDVIGDLLGGLEALLRSMPPEQRRAELDAGHRRALLSKVSDRALLIVANDGSASYNNNSNNADVDGGGGEGSTSGDDSTSAARPPAEEHLRSFAEFLRQNDNSSPFDDAENGEPRARDWIDHLFAALDGASASTTDDVSESLWTIRNVGSDRAEAAGLRKLFDRGLIGRLLRLVAAVEGGVVKLPRLILIETASALQAVIVGGHRSNCIAPADLRDVAVSAARAIPTLVDGTGDDTVTAEYAFVFSIAAAKADADLRGEPAVRLLANFARQDLPPSAYSSTRIHLTTAFAALTERTSAAVDDDPAVAAAAKPASYASSSLDLLAARVLRNGEEHSPVGGGMEWWRTRSAAVPTINNDDDSVAARGGDGLHKSTTTTTATTFGHKPSSSLSPGVLTASHRAPAAGPAVEAARALAGSPTPPDHGVGTDSAQTTATTSPSFPALLQEAATSTDDTGTQSSPGKTGKSSGGAPGSGRAIRAVQAARVVHDAPVTTAATPEPRVSVHLPSSTQLRSATPQPEAAPSQGVVLAAGGIRKSSAVSPSSASAPKQAAGSRRVHRLATTTTTTTGLTAMVSIVVADTSADVVWPAALVTIIAAEVGGGPNRDALSSTALLPIDVSKRCAPRALDFGPLPGLKGAMPAPPLSYTACASLVSVDTTGLAHVTALGSDWFAGCHALTALDVSGLGSVSEVADGFCDGCSSLAAINLGGLRSLRKVGARFLARCHALEEVDTAPLAEEETPPLAEVGADWMRECGGLERFGAAGLKGVVALPDGFLAECTSLTEVGGAVDGFASLRAVGSHFMSRCLSLRSLDTRSLGGVVRVGECFLSMCVMLPAFDASNLSSLRQAGPHLLMGCSAELHRSTKDTLLAQTTKPV